jgi:hypothetical protein
VARHLQGSKRKSAAAFCRLAATHEHPGSRE